MVRWLAENSSEDAHNVVIGRKHTLNKIKLFQLGFGVQLQPGNWKYAHLCYLEEILRVTLVVVGQSGPRSTYSRIYHDALKFESHILLEWDDLKPLQHKYGSRPYQARNYDKWYPITHKNVYLWDNNGIAIALIQRMDPIIQALLKLPEQFTMLTNCIATLGKRRSHP